ncbi:MAG: UDP-3-O-(3-hydroxymyristoyl)glucosamine N-acyltransferase [Bacteroidia bacterium]|jgi:UDP-3-O-[3-hydroxymyristoyl] glucosamine N-acyltransferase
MQVTVAELAKILNGDIIGDQNATVSKVARIEDGEAGALSFLSNPKYEPYLYETKSTVVIVNRTFVPSKPTLANLIKVDDAYAGFTFLLEKFSNKMAGKTGVHDTAVVAGSSKLAPDVYVGELTCIADNVTIAEGTVIYPQVYIGEGSKLGKNCILYPGVRIYHDTIIGDNCILHAGVVIGGDGFGFAPLADRSYRKIPQTGNVIIEDDVEMGSNTTVDRATLGSTIIRKGVKLDNLVQVAHNVEIGEHTVIASQSGIAGSTKIGKYCVVAGQVGFGGHLTIADGSIFGGQTGVTGNITKPNEKWLGFPATEYGKIIRSYAMFKHLPDLEKRISALEKNQTFK